VKPLQLEHVDLPCRFPHMGNVTRRRPGVRRQTAGRCFYRSGRYRTWPSHSPGLLHSVSKSNVIDGGAQPEVTAHFEHAGHRLALQDAAVGVGCDGRHVVGQQNPVMFGSPRQEGLVVDTRQAEILRADDVNLRLSAEHRAQDIVIEILVG
jgi:hypothetical protein